MKSNPGMGAHFSHDFVRYSQAHFGASLGLRITVVANGHGDRLEMATDMRFRDEEPAK
jgi:hypothetical protein